MNYPPPDASTKIWFNQDGSIDQVTTRAYIEMPPGLPPLVHDYSYMEPPDGPVYLLLCTGEDDDIDVTQLETTQFAADDNNMWIVIDHRNGSVSVGKIGEFQPVDSFGTSLDKSRDLSRNRRSATP